MTSRNEPLSSTNGHYNSIYFQHQTIDKICSVFVSNVSVRKEMLTVLLQVISKILSNLALTFSNKSYPLTSL